MTGGKLIRPAPAEIEFKNMRFLITEQPHDSTIQNYITILKEHKVTHLVCATDPTYKTDDLAQSGVTFTELSFLDGSPPSQDIIDKWLSLVKKVSIAQIQQWGRSRTFNVEARLYIGISHFLYPLSLTGVSESRGGRKLHWSALCNGPRPCPSLGCSCSNRIGYEVRRCCRTDPKETPGSH